MDKLNRLTRNDEWQVGARYRWTKGRVSRLARRTWTTWRRS